MKRFRLGFSNRPPLGRSGSAGLLLEAIKAGLILSGLLLLVAAGRWTDQTRSSESLKSAAAADEDDVTREPIHGLVLSADERTLLLVRRCGRLSIVDQERNVVVAEHDEWQWRVCTATLTPDGGTLVAGMHDGSVKFIAVGRDVPPEEGDRQHDGHVRSVAISPDGSRMVTGGAECLMLWDLPERRCLQSVTDAETIKDLQYSPDGKRIVGISGFDAVRIWDADSLDVLKTYRHPARVVNVEFVGDGRCVLSADCTGNLRMRGLDVDGPEWDRDGMWPDIWGLAVSPDGRTAAIAVGTNHAICLVDLDDQLPFGQFLGHRMSPKYLRFTADGKRLYSGSHDGSHHVWDVGGVARRPSISWSDRSVAKVRASSNGI